MSLRFDSSSYCWTVIPNFETIELCKKIKKNNNLYKRNNSFQGKRTDRVINSTSNKSIGLDLDRTSFNKIETRISNNKVGRLADKLNTI